MRVRADIEANAVPALASFDDVGNAAVVLNIDRQSDCQLFHTWPSATTAWEQLIIANPDVDRPHGLAMLGTCRLGDEPLRPAP